MPVINTESDLYQFRKAIYDQFNARGDSAMDLLDALCSNHHARSVVELSLNPLFRRNYSSVFKAIGEALVPSLASEEEENEQRSIIELVGQTVPSPEAQAYFLFGIDCTHVERCYAKTLDDRSFVHRPTAVSQQKPITIGHSYSMVAALPERERGDARWSIPLDVTRVPTDSTALEVGVQQVDAIMGAQAVDWQHQLSVLVVDSAYGVKGFLSPIQQYSSLVSVARVRSNRVFYQRPVPVSSSSGKGRPRWYGERFALNDGDTWHPADETIEVTERGKQGPIHVRLQSWSHLLMRGAKAHPMQEHPFTLIRVERRNAQGQRIGQVMWLIVIGNCRDQISLLQAYRAYRQRFDLEHTFRFLKGNLLLNAFQTPEVDHEQGWLTLVMLAYVQLWAAQSISVQTPNPWESSKEPRPNTRITPSKVQLDWNRIIRQIGSPAPAPKPRGKSPGRQLGQSQTPRLRRPIIKKGKSQSAEHKSAA